MSDKTEAQKWKQRLKEDCEVVGEPRNASHADTRYFDHLHDLADCGYDRAEEIAASVAALTEEFSSFRMFTSANLRTADRSIAIERERIDAIEAKHGGSSDFYHEPVSPVPPPPDADAGDAFVDALCREYARRATAVQFYPGNELSHFRQLYLYVKDIHDFPQIAAIHDAMLARAAALPERSAAAPVTITWSRLSELLIVYVKAIPKGDTAHLTGLRAVVEALGYRMDGERP